jgi:hypothetical protein
MVAFTVSNNYVNWYCRSFNLDGLLGTSGVALLECEGPGKRY